MATPSEIQAELRRMLAAYPQHAERLKDAQLADMAEVWTTDLADLPANLLTMACKNHRERSQWLPSIAEIRASAVSLMRQSSPADQDWNEAWAELQRQILRVGYIGVPEWTNPALAETVKTLGGWRAVCMNEDPEGVARAQFRDVYSIVISRMERKVTQSPEVRAFVASMTAPTDHQLEAGDAQDLIKRLAEAKRVS
jgi:hypothetical protein